MRTPRNILASRLGPWIDKGDANGSGPLRFVQLVHVREGGLEKTIDKFRADGETAGSLSEKIYQAAQDDAENNPAAIREEYGIHAYFGNEEHPGAFVRFPVRAAPSVDSDEAGVGAFSEGANPRGQTHQGMRHIEAMARIHLEGVQRHEESVMSFSKGLMEDNKNLRIKNSELFDAAEEAKDRSMERSLALYRIHSEEDRKTKMMQSIVPAIFMFANAALGKPIFPVDAQADQGILAFKNMLRGWGPEKFASIKATLDPQEAMFLETVKNQIMDEDEKAEKEREKAAEAQVKGVAGSQEVKDIVVKRDAEGIPRPPL
jgi:hypothetical protein